MPGLLEADKLADSNSVAFALARKRKGRRLRRVVFATAVTRRYGITLAPHHLGAVRKRDARYSSRRGPRASVCVACL